MSELGNVQRKCAALREEVRNLEAAIRESDGPDLRDEIDQYRKALSNILYRLESGPIDEVTLRKIVGNALCYPALRDHFRRRQEA